MTYKVYKNCFETLSISGFNERGKSYTTCRMIQKIGYAQNQSGNGSENLAPPNESVRLEDNSIVSSMFSLGARDTDSPKN